MSDSTKRTKRLGSLKPRRTAAPSTSTPTPVPPPQDPPIDFEEEGQFDDEPELMDEDLDLEKQEPVQKSTSSSSSRKPKFVPKAPQQRVVSDSTSIQPKLLERVELDQRGRIKVERGRGRGRGQMEFRAAESAFGLGPAASAGRGSSVSHSGSSGSGGGGSLYISKLAARGFEKGDDDIDTITFDDDDEDDTEFDQHDQYAPIRIGAGAKAKANLIKRERIKRESVKRESMQPKKEKSTVKEPKLKAKEEIEEDEKLGIDIDLDAEEPLKSDLFDEIGEDIFSLNNSLEDKHFGFFTMPSVLPVYPSSHQERQRGGGNQSESDKYTFRTMPNPAESVLPKRDGKIGKMKVYKDGRTMLKIGDIWFNVTTAAAASSADCHQEVLAIDPKGEAVHLQDIVRKYVCVPDLDQLLSATNEDRFDE